MLEKSGLVSAEQLQTVIFPTLSINPKFCFWSSNYDASRVINEENKKNKKICGLFYCLVLLLQTWFTRGLPQMLFHMSVNLDIE